MILAPETGADRLKQNHQNMRMIVPSALAFCLTLTTLLAETAEFDLKIEGAVQVSFQAEQGKLYQIESSQDVVPPIWAIEGRTIEGAGERHNAVFLPGETGKRVYRVQELNLTNGLVGYFPFNGNANDESGRGNNAVGVNNPLLSSNRFDQPASAYSFFEPEQYVATTNSNGFPTGTEDFTVSIWVNAAEENRTSGDGHGVLFSNFSADDFQLDVFWAQNSKAQIQFHTGGLKFQGPADCGTSDIDWDFGRWYNVQLVRSGNTLRIYRSGELLATSDTTQGNDAPADRRNLQFGFRTPVSAHQFYGSLDDIRVYNRALSAGELKALNEIRE